MPRKLPRFVANVRELEALLLGLKELLCPKCQKVGTLNRHSRCLGSDLSAQGESVRGRRAFCSNRGKRPGCGRSFSIFLASVLPRHTITAPLFWKLLLQWLSGSTIWASHKALAVPFGRDGAYALLRRLRRRLDGLRSWLCRLIYPPSSTQTDPLLQTVEHFRAAFSKSACCLAEFQNHFQAPLMG